jgi:hypothetical protein
MARLDNFKAQVWEVSECLCRFLRSLDLIGWSEVGGFVCELSRFP